MIKLREAWVLVMMDRRKAGALLVLGLVLVVLVGKQFLEGGPRSASAASEEGSENDILEAGGRAITLDELRLEGPMIEVRVPQGADRNVFGFEERFFPPPAQSASSSEVGEKSEADAVESPKEAGRVHAEQIARLVREEAGGLRLKSILMGPSPMVVIEYGARGRRTARTLRVGDQVNGFTLVSVEESGVVIEKHGVRVELER